MFYHGKNLVKLGGVPRTTKAFGLVVEIEPLDPNVKHTRKDRLQIHRAKNLNKLRKRNSYQNQRNRLDDSRAWTPVSESHDNLHYIVEHKLLLYSREAWRRGMEHTHTRTSLREIFFLTYTEHSFSEIAKLKIDFAIFYFEIYIPQSYEHGYGGEVTNLTWSLTPWSLTDYIVVGVFWLAPLAYHVHMDTRLHPTLTWSLMDYIVGEWFGNQPCISCPRGHPLGIHMYQNS